MFNANTTPMNEPSKTPTNACVNPCITKVAKIVLSLAPIVFKIAILPSFSRTSMTREDTILKLATAIIKNTTI